MQLKAKAIGNIVNLSMAVYKIELHLQSSGT